MNKKELKLATVLDENMVYQVQLELLMEHRVISRKDRILTEKFFGQEKVIIP
jgi:hypothetical protein